MAVAVKMQLKCLSAEITEIIYTLIINVGKKTNFHNEVKQIRGIAETEEMKPTFDGSINALCLGTWYNCIMLKGRLARWP